MAGRSVGRCSCIGAKRIEKMLMHQLPAQQTPEPTPKAKNKAKAKTKAKSKGKGSQQEVGSIALRYVCM